MKKLFPDNKVSRKSVLEFLDKKGFYIILVLCIVIVGATAVFVTTHDVTSSNQDFVGDKIIPEEMDNEGNPDLLSDLGDEAPIDTPAVSPEQQETTAASKESGTDAAKSSENKVAEAQSDSNKAEDTKQSVSAAAAAKTTKATPTPKPSSSKSDKTTTDQKFIMPVLGEITFDYAMDRLAYSKTLEEWRTHSGVDIASDRGTPVKVVADGVISEVKDDPRFGATIIVDHENGLKTVYSNLASNEMVNPNQKVAQDEIIGSVGDTAVFESVEQSHLHFEVLKDDVNVDPNSYLPKN